MTVKAADNANADATFRRAAWRFMPLLFICYVVAYLDRVNVGFAKLQMLNDLRFSEAVYGFGAGHERHRGALPLVSVARRKSKSTP